MNNLPEILGVYDLNGILLGIQERSKFYTEIEQEFNTTGKITRQIKTIKLLLMNSDGRIYVQKRSKLKRENSGLWDKTVGGHVLENHSWSLTLVKECAEELGVPVALLPSEEFDRSVRAADLSIIAIIRELAVVPNFLSHRKSLNGDFIQPLISGFYIGYYDGAIRFVDGESSGIEIFSREELLAEIQDHPERFTEDLKFMMGHYQEYFVPIR